MDGIIDVIGRGLALVIFFMGGFQAFNGEVATLQAHASENSEEKTKGHRALAVGVALVALSFVTPTIVREIANNAPKF